MGSSKMILSSSTLPRRMEFEEFVITAHASLLKNATNEAIYDLDGLSLKTPEVSAEIKFFSVTGSEKFGMV